MGKRPVLGKECYGIPSVNFHLWQPCNMRCKFCFARFEETRDYLKNNREVSKKNCIKIINQANNAGIRKITFVGGEPLLCPWLPKLLRITKEHGIKTMIVSNGALLDNSWLQQHSELVDWFTLSVDSLSLHNNLRMGRAIGGIKPITRRRYFELAKLIESYGIKLKINTTVTQFNWQECLADFIGTVKPVRWKIFQALKINGQNESDFDQVRVSENGFNAFVERHLHMKSECKVIIENNDAMTSSYLMIDPIGRFFDNELGRYRYSDPIWQVGWKVALKQVAVNSNKFFERDGLYDW